MHKIIYKKNGISTFFNCIFWLFLGVLLNTLLPLPATPETKGDDTILAKVNDVSITKTNLDRLIAQFKIKSGKESITLDEKKQLLKNLTIRQLILQTPAVRAMKKEEPVVKKVAEFENSLVISRFIKESVDKQVSLNHGELAGYYKNHKARFSSDIKIEASVILLRTKTDAAMVLEKLQKGEPFEEMARKNSIDLPSAQKGGSLGAVKIGTVYPEVWKELNKLKQGEISQIIETKYGYNILTVNKILAPEIKPFQEVKAEIRDALLREKREKVYDAMVKELEKSAVLKIFENRLAGIGAKK
jgi:parvulin-like peptidyl-prolyl isomerase